MFDVSKSRQMAACDPTVGEMKSGKATVLGARIIDPVAGVDEVRDMAFDADEPQDIDATGMILVPGLIDLHTHVYPGGTSLGIDPDAYMLESGVTTSVDTGSAGPGNFAGFRDHVMTRSEARVLAFLHVSFAGIFGFDHAIQVGESEDMRLMAPAQAVDVALANPDHVIGIKVRVGRHASGDQGIAPLKIARQVADEARLPLMAHIDEPPPTYAQVLAELREGDILTHAFRPFPNAPLVGDTPIPEVWEARQNGVIFDIGHGMGSFSFDVARKMLAAGFGPDVISSDVHALCIDGPAFDLPTTMTKFLALGMDLTTIIRTVTEAPANAIRRPDLASLHADGDATLLEIAPNATTLRDTVGSTITSDQTIEVRAVVRAGRIVSRSA